VDKRFNALGFLEFLRGSKTVATSERREMRQRRGTERWVNGGAKQEHGQREIRRPRTEGNHPGQRDKATDGGVRNR